MFRQHKNPISAPRTATSNRAKLIRKKIDDFRRTYEDHSRRAVRLLRPNLVSLARWATCLLLVFYIFDYLAVAAGPETLVIRILSACALAPFGSRALLANHQNRLHQYLPVALTYALPFSFGLCLALNVDPSSSTIGVATYWLGAYLVILFIFTQVIGSSYVSVPLWMASFIVVISIASITSGGFSSDSLNLIYSQIGLFVTAVVVGSWTNRNHRILEIEKQDTASAMGAVVAHELRTPLSTIGSYSRAGSEFMHELVEGYRYATDRGFKPLLLDKSKISGLKFSLDAITEEADYAHILIDMMLVNASQSQFAAGHSDILPVIQEAIERFPFNNEYEREITVLDCCHEFEIPLPHRIAVHVVWNLMKNAIFWSQSSPGSCVLISTAIADQRSVLEIWDNGPGLPPEEIPRAFQRFHSLREPGLGAGLGLGFCKTVVEEAGGDIEISSETGNFFSAKISFPQKERTGN